MWAVSEYAQFGEPVHLAQAVTGLEERDGHFVLTDLSSNGTFLLVDEHLNEMHLRREEAVLGGRGWIGLGKNATRHGDHSVRYSLQAEGV